MTSKKVSKEDKVKILVVDDHPVLRKGIVYLIDSQPDLMVCGEADDARKALDAVTSTKPQMALVDITLQDTNGLELIKNIIAILPDLPILVLSMHDETLYAERALRAGARGYIMKQEATDNLLTAIRQIMSGEIYLSRKMETKLLRQFASGRPASAGTSLDRLSDRELEVFHLIGQGNSTRDIAEQLHISVKTVETHRMHIMEKLDLKNSPELMRFAIQWVESGN